MSASLPQIELKDHYERCFLEHGRTPRGVDWPSQADLETRFEVMLGVVRQRPARPRLLDLGCGPGLLLDHLEATGRRTHLDYVGVDLSAPMLASARQRWPDYLFLKHDILAEPPQELAADYVVMNGVLTERRSVPHDRMEAYALDLLAVAFSHARVGLAFNVMSKVVDWEREDLFHWSFDAMAAGVARRLSRHMRIRADYGLFEYTVYVYREPEA